MAGSPSHPTIHASRSCERKASYTAQTKRPSPLRHATSYSLSSSRSSSLTSSDSAASSSTPTHSETQSILSSLSLELVDRLALTRPKLFHLLPIPKRSDKHLAQSNIHPAIAISIHTSESGTTTSLSSSSESSEHSMLKLKRRSTLNSGPRASNATTILKTSSKPKKSRAGKARATPALRASLPERKRQRHVSFLPPGIQPGPKVPKELHPLLAFSPVRRLTRLLDLQSHCNPLSLAYDVSRPPSPYSLTITRSLGDHNRTQKSSKVSLDFKSIADTLSEPATVPPTTSQLILTSSKFPWEVIATSTHTSSKSSPNASCSSIALARHTSNLDVLHAIHLTLAARVTPDEWTALSNSAKKQVLKAYESRCIRTDGGWDEGVCRMDYLCGKTLLVGIEFLREKEKDGVEFVKGRMIFEYPPH